MALLSGSQATSGINCCKKWEGGTLRKFYSKQPCSAQGAVMCSEPDPEKPIGTQTTGPGQTQAAAKAASVIDPGGDDRCEDGFHWDNIENRCVPDAPKPPGEEDCKYPGFHWDPEQGKCVPTYPHCEDGTHWDTLKKKCVPDVPKKCSGGMVWDVDLEQCVPDTDTRCDHLGPGFHWSDTENRCVPDVDTRCDDGFHWDNDQQVCVPDKQTGCGAGGFKTDPEDDCPTGFELRYLDGGWWCCPEQGECDPGFHMDPNTGMCVPDDDDDDDDDDDNGNGNGNGNGDGNGGEEFEWGEGLQGLLGRIQERANYLLDYPRGLTPSERQGVINYAIESVKSGEKGAIQSKRDQLARAGLLGSGFEFDEIGKIQRETRASQTQVRRELGIDELDRRFQELMGTTGMAQGLTGTLMEGEKIPEILSGARRAEGQAALNSFLSLLGGSMGGQNNPYWQAIINQMMGGQGGSGMMDWLPWLLTSLGGGGSNA